MTYEPGYEPQTIDQDRLSPAVREFLIRQGVPLPPLPDHADRSIDPCPEWHCPDLSAEDRRDGKTCPEHPCTCAPAYTNRSAS